MITSPPASAGHRPVYVFGPFRLDVAERRLTRDGGDIALTRKTFDLLLALIESAGRLRSRESLIDALWPDTIVEEHSLTWNLSALRRALGDTGDAPRFIETVRGHGYRFMAPVVDEGEPAPAPDREIPTLQTVAGHAPPAAHAMRDDGEADASHEDSAASLARRRRAVAAIVLAALLLALGVWIVRFGGQCLAESPVAPPRSIAVLPFENLSADPANAYFASGVQDTILTKLAGIRDLRVVSRMSTEGYRNRPAGLAEVARELDVASVLEGSVQRAGDDVLINVQLVDPRNGSHLWAQTYQRALDKVFDVQSDVAGQVAAALQAELLPAEAHRVAALPTADVAAYDLFLKAEYAALQIEFGNAKSPAAATAQARALYRDALARDPRFALAHARLSYLDSHAYWLDIEHTPERVASAEAEARAALALDADLPQAHLAMGYVHYYGHRDYDAALAEFQRALRDLPSNADVNASIANIDRRRGQWEAALSGYERAAALDPRNPQWSILRGDTLATLRRYPESEAAYDRARSIDPDNPAAALYQSLALLLAGDVERAASTLAGLPRDADPEGLGTSIRFIAAWLAHDADAALAVLATAPASIDAPWTPGFVPTDLLRAQALELKGDAGAAAQAYARARAALEKTAAAQPNDPATLSLLGLALAGLGERDAALAAGHRAVDLLPLDEDAIDGPYYPATLAEIEIRLGDTDAALPELRRLLAIPAGRVMSEALIARDARFERVRAELAHGDDR